VGIKLPICAYKRRDSQPNTCRPIIAYKISNTLKILIIISRKVSNDMIGADMSTLSIAAQRQFPQSQSGLFCEALMPYLPVREGPSSTRYGPVELNDCPNQAHLFVSTGPEWFSPTRTAYGKELGRRLERWKTGR